MSMMHEPCVHRIGVRCLATLHYAVPVRGSGVYASTRQYARLRSIVYTAFIDTVRIDTRQYAHFNLYLYTIL